MNRKYIGNQRVSNLWIVVVLILMSAVSVHAVTFDVSATVDGTYEQIGWLTADYVNYGNPPNGQRAEEGVFQMNIGAAHLIGDPHCQFRFFQIVTEDTDPIPYLGNALNAPYVDPPKSGWDYQRMPANDWQNGTPGADDAPFYENNDDAGNYAFPKYSGTFQVFGGNVNANVPVHDDATATVRTVDVPGTTNGNSVRFWTFITFMNRQMRINKEFVLVWGYSWGFSISAAGNFTYDAIAELTDVNLIDDGVQAMITNAMGADGFNDWTPLFRDVELVCPEPATVTLWVAGLMLVRRRAA